MLYFPPFFECPLLFSSSTLCNKNIYIWHKKTIYIDESKKDTHKMHQFLIHATNNKLSEFQLRTKTNEVPGKGVSLIGFSLVHKII